MQFFRDYTLGFLRSVDDERVEDIILKRYALEGYKKHTLKELGSFYGLSRERIRQIEFSHLSKLKKLMMDRDRISETAESVHELVEKERIIPKHKVKEMLNSHPDLIAWELFYLDLIGVLYFKEGKLYHTKDIKRNELIKTLRMIRSTLREHTIPMERDLLFKKVNFINLKEPELDILTCLTKATPRVIDGVTCYQSHIDQEWSAGRLAHLILWENGSVMTTDEILSEMNDRFNIDKKVFNTVNQMGTMETIQNIDLHTWALQEWGLESNYVLHIMEEVLREHGDPMTTEEIIDEIRQVRSGVRPESVKAYTSLEIYTRLEDGRIALSEWNEAAI